VGDHYCGRKGDASEISTTEVISKRAHEFGTGLLKQ
jgi:hypothetical protein